MSETPTTVLRAPCADVAQLAASASALVSQLADAVKDASEASAELGNDPSGTCDLAAVRLLLTKAQGIIRCALPDMDALLVAVGAELAWRSRT